MAVDIKELAKRGVSGGAYKAIFTNNKLSRKQEKLIATIASRLQTGRENNLKDYRTFWAIDLAFETPFAQTTPTLIQSLLSRNLSASETLEALKSYGLSESDLFLKIDVGNNVQKLVINPPVFFQILIPIVRAYHTVRTARIFNERDRSPLFKYPPAKETDENRVLCEILGGVVDTTAQWYGYSEYLRQAIAQTLKYGVMLAFPKEEWHHEAQIIDGKVEIQKEGLRYDMPHPTRMGYDLHHPLPTINTDSGCEYAYYWDVVRYGDVMDNRKYWNRDAISFGTNWMDQPLYRNYFHEVFPCQLKHPVPSDPTAKREDRAAYYSAGHRDSALFLTHYFGKVAPRDYDLGDYKYPVWHRFTVASDSTILWAAPCAYNPTWFMGYDWDNQAGQPSSFSLECIPWQDHIGNLLSQMILTAKQNLTNVQFYDKRIISPDDLKRMENLGEQRYRTINYIGYDSAQMSRAGIDIKSAIHSPALQYRSIVELQTMLSTAINLMERILQITAQETGAVAQHYQSKEEIITTRNSTDTRVNFTASGIDSGVDAWKKQLFDATMAYRNDTVEAHVTSDIEKLDELVAKIGFKVIGSGPRRKLVRGSKAKLRYVEFARSNTSPQNNTDPQMSQVIFQTMQIISQKPEFVQAIGVPRILKLLEQGAKLAGAPEDFDITGVAEGAGAGMMPEALMQQLTPILQQLQQSTLGIVMEKVAKPAAESAAKQEQEIRQLNQIVEKLSGIFKIAEAQQQKTAIKAAETEQAMAIKQAEFEAEQRRREEEHQQELRRTQEKAQLDAALGASTAQIQVQTEAAKAQTAIELKEKEAESKIATQRAIAQTQIETANKIANATVKRAKKTAAKKPD